MHPDLWLPRNFELVNGQAVGRRLHSGERWQTYQLNDNSTLLVLETELTEQLIETGLLSPGHLSDVKFGDRQYQSLVSPPEFCISPVWESATPFAKVDAIAFSQALRNSREKAPDIPFHDAIYVEQYSSLLPTWTLSSALDDEVVLGRWLTGGVEIPVTSFRRLTTLVGWLPPSDVADIIQLSGFDVPEQYRSVKTEKTNLHQENKSVAEPIPELSEEQPRESSSRFRLQGRPKLEVFFNDHVVDIVQNKERYAALGINFPSAIILHGPPGCGKTYAVEKLVEFLDWPMFSIDSGTVGSPYIHETSKKIADVFERAMDSSPSVLVIDEMEAFLTERNIGSSGGQHHVEEVAEFLRRIPEATKNEVLVVAMTNMIERIDPAICRRGRFDHIIEVGMPSAEEVRSLLDHLLRQIPTEETIKLDQLIQSLTGRALSDAAFVIREGARVAAKAGKDKLDEVSLELALTSLPDQVTKASRPIGFIWNEE